MTLVEIMVVVAIVVLLLAILLPAISKLRDKAKTDTAKAQMQMIAMAIDEFARFWPAWKTGTTKGPPPIPGEPICSRGLPPWREWELWTGRAGIGLNDVITFSVDPNAPWVPGDPGVSILRANQCLAYALTVKKGGGPFLKKAPPSMLEYVPLNTGDPNTYYPGTGPPSVSTGNEVQRVRLIDPWGTPYFYCWAAEDGMWLVWENFPALPSHLPWPGTHFIAEELVQHQGHTAVLISAGPNKRFDFLDRLPLPGDPNTILGSRMKTWDGDDIVLGR